VTEHKGPKDRLLDLLVFGPAGLALTAAEEFPKLVEKGRHRVEGQLHTARLVGQFAVQMGRRQLESSLGGLRPGGDGGSQPTPQGPSGAASSGASPMTSSAPAGGAKPQVAQEPAPPQRTTAGSDNGALASDVLGIPGYDSLSASQVVQRLGGLSAGELEAIRAHELAHRHRRTILNRVEQLLGPTAQG
jgi:hypothetical protein